MASVTIGDGAVASNLIGDGAVASNLTVVIQQFYCLVRQLLFVVRIVT